MNKILIEEATAQQVLAALESLTRYDMTRQEKAKPAITALRDALAAPTVKKSLTVAPAPVHEPVGEAMARYLRVCSSGGMPKKLRESVQSLVEDAQRLGYFKAAPQPEQHACHCTQGQACQVCDPDLGNPIEQAAPLIRGDIRDGLVDDEPAQQQEQAPVAWAKQTDKKLRIALNMQGMAGWRPLVYGDTPQNSKRSPGEN